MKLEITIYDAAGNVVAHDITEANTATDDEIADMVRLVEGGMPASLAAAVAKTAPQPTTLTAE